FTADVPELLEVEVLRALGGLDAERRVAACAALAGDVVLLLHLVGQRVEPAERRVGVVDQFLRDAVVADAREPPFAVGGAEFGHERVAVAVEAADVEGRDTGTHAGLRERLRSGIRPARRAGGTDPGQLMRRRRRGRRRRGIRGWTAPAPRRRPRPSPAP